MAETPLDKVLLNVDRIDRIVKYAKSIGATDELAEVFATSKASARLQWDGAALTLDGVNVIDDAATKEHFTKGPLAPLFPAANVTNETAPKIPPELLADAKGGNWTSIGAIARIVGSREAAEALIAEKTGDEPGTITVVDATAPVKPAALKAVTNPWTADTTDEAGRPAWSLAARKRQTDLVKSIGPEKASAIAKAANSFLGATRPGATNLTSSRRSA